MDARKAHYISIVVDACILLGSPGFVTIFIKYVREFELAAFSFVSAVHDFLD